LKNINIIYIVIEF